MKIFGFVAEFNPFHNGHKLFIQKIRNKYHPDVLIAVMSGNYVQRGDFAVLDKNVRAKIAVDNGVDLVVELPFEKAVQPANIFASKSVEILSDLGITDLVFGTESMIDFDTVVQKITANEELFEQDYSKNYAQNFNDFLERLGIDTRDQPNKTLGIDYSLAVQKINSQIDLHPLVRPQNSFSATKTRSLINQNDFVRVSDLVPEDTLRFLKNESLVTWKNLFPFLRYKILTNSVDELQLTYQMVEGLNFKIKKEVRSANDFSELVSLVKSKRYTEARIRRLLMYVLVNTSAAEIDQSLKQKYIHILAFDHVGQEYLSSRRKQIELPLITKVGKQQQAQMTTVIKADSIYQMINNNKQNFGVIPYIKGDN